jgi:PKD repeat protein
VPVSPSAAAVPKVVNPNQVPVADAGGPYTVEEGSTVQLDGRGSIDPDGEIVGWAWSKPGRLDDASLAEPAFRGIDDGRIAIELTVTDDDGAMATDATRVRVTNADPVITAVDHALAADTLTLDVAIDDPGARDTHQLRVDWGDGTSDTVALDAGVTMASLAHTYADPGEHTVTLTVTDDDGGTATADLVVTIAPRAIAPPSSETPLTEG